MHGTIYTPFERILKWRRRKCCVNNDLAAHCVNLIEDGSANYQKEIKQSANLVRIILQIPRFAEGIDRGFNPSEVTRLEFIVNINDRLMITIKSNSEV